MCTFAALQERAKHATRLSKVIQVCYFLMDSVTKGEKVTV